MFVVVLDGFLGLCQTVASAIIVPALAGKVCSAVKMGLKKPSVTVMFSSKSGRKKAHKHKLFALVNVQMALGQTAGCPRVNRAKKFMCSPRNTGNINFSLWLTGGLSQGCPSFQKVYVFKVYVPFSCPTKGIGQLPVQEMIQI